MGQISLENDPSDNSDVVEWEITDIETNGCLKNSKVGKDDDITDYMAICGHRKQKLRQRQKLKEEECRDNDNK